VTAIHHARSRRGPPSADGIAARSALAKVLTPEVTEASFRSFRS
jgi:hypothetical protein